MITYLMGKKYFWKQQKKGKQRKYCKMKHERAKTAAKREMEK
jgi:hypothetical protein